MWVNGELSHTFRYSDSGSWSGDNEDGERFFRYTELWENETRFQETLLVVAGTSPALPRRASCES